VSVTSARVHTLGADAVDVFYIQSADHTALSPARAREIAAGVAAALA
jgi:[protein-PII] uridylyltransferase